MTVKKQERKSITSVDLGKGVAEVLQGLVERTGKTQSEIIREAIVSYDYHSLYNWAGSTKLVNDTKAGKVK